MRAFYSEFNWVISVKVSVDFCNITYIRWFDLGAFSFDWGSIAMKMCTVLTNQVHRVKDWTVNPSYCTSGNVLFF